MGNYGLICALAIIAMANLSSSKELEHEMLEAPLGEEHHRQRRTIMEFKMGLLKGIMQALIPGAQGQNQYPQYPQYPQWPYQPQGYSYPHGYGYPHGSGYSQGYHYPQGYVNPYAPNGHQPGYGYPQGSGYGGAFG